MNACVQVHFFHPHGLNTGLHPKSGEKGYTSPPKLLNMGIGLSYNHIIYRIKNKHILTGIKLELCKRPSDDHPGLFKIRKLFKIIFNFSTFLSGTYFQLSFKNQ